MDHFSKENTNCLKGIFALCVLFHHISQYITITNNLFFCGVFEALGYLSVAVFFFLSGYGIMHNTANKPGYIQHFPSQRLLPLYTVYIFTAILYVIYDLIFQLPVTPALLLKTITFGDTVVLNGWYFQALIILNLLFYLCYCFGGKYKELLFGLSILLYCVICVAINPYSHLLYEAVLAFPFGVWFFNNRVSLERIFQQPKKYYWGLGISSLLLIISFAPQTIHLNDLPVWGGIIIRMFSALFFVIVIVFLVSRLRISYGITRFCGKYSLEIYALQGICLFFFHSKFVYIQSSVLYFLCAVASTFLLSILVSPVYTWIHKKCRF